MRVHIDEAGRDQHSGGVDFFGAFPGYGAHMGNAIAVYRHVCDERFPAQPVGHQSVANYQVMIGHRRLSPDILD